MPPAHSMPRAGAGRAGLAALPAGAPNLGYSDAVWWFDLRWDPPPGGGAGSRLELAYPVLDRVEIRLFDRDGVERGHWRLGDKQPFGQRPVPHRHFIVPLPRAAPGQEGGAGPGAGAHQQRGAVAGSSGPSRPSWPASSSTRLVQGLYLGVMLGMLATTSSCGG